MVFYGQEIINGKESDEAVQDFDVYLDEYSRSKRISEDLILAANGNQNLRTSVLRYVRTCVRNTMTHPEVRIQSVLMLFSFCCYRIGGLVGPNERAIIPRTLRCVRSGILKYIYLLQEDLKVDFLFIENAVQAHIKVRRKTNKTYTRH